MGMVNLYEYDTSGNIVKATDSNGVITQYSYNGLGLLTKQDNSKSGTILYEYDCYGQPIKITDSDETKLIKYNTFGEIIETVGNFADDTYSYDLDGNMIKHIVHDKDIGEYETEYTYSASGLVTSIKTGMGTELINYDKAGRIAEKQNSATGLSKSYQYYPDNNVKEIRTRMDGRLVYYENFEYDKNGNKIYDDQNGSIKTYRYDGMNRLIGVTENDNFRTEYEFDNYNNISKEYEIIGAEISKKSYYYDKGNHLLLEDSKSRTVQYEYDNAGNLIKKITGIGYNAESAYYTYDGYNRLSSYIDNITLSEYTYNIDGLRQSKTVNGIKTKYVYDQENIIGEMTEDNIYTYYRATELIGYTSNKDDRYYYRQNSHGDVTALLDIQGNEIKNYTYNTYGKENPFVINPMGEQTILFQWKAETEKMHNPFRYCGEYYDDETELIYLRNRYYDSSIGRFISEDPIRSGTNWYVYANNNPVNYIDPLGLASYVIYEEGTISGDGEHTFNDEALIRKKQLEDTWGTEVYLLPVSSAEDFENVWNYRVGYDWEGYDIPIEEVVIIAHGSISGDKDKKTAQSYFYFGHKESKVYAKSNLDGEGDNVVVNNLAWKQMKWLTFSTCNSGHLDVYNLAHAFKKRMTIEEYIVAWDGGTFFDYSDGQLKAGTGRQPTWKKYVDKTWYGRAVRKRIGYRQIKG